MIKSRFVAMTFLIVTNRIVNKVDMNGPQQGGLTKCWTSYLTMDPGEDTTLHVYSKIDAILSRCFSFVHNLVTSEYYYLLAAKISCAHIETEIKTALLEVLNKLRRFYAPTS